MSLLALEWDPTPSNSQVSDVTDSPTKDDKGKLLFILET
jgi:hypothetical protein